MVTTGKNVEHFSQRHKYVLLLPATYISHKGSVEQQSVFLNSRQWHLAQQYIQNVLFPFPCNKG